MNNLASLMKTADEIHISKKERKYLIQEAVRILGKDKELIMVIEEIAELMNVMSTNIIEGFNYMHTVEEVTDVLIGMRTLSVIANIPMPKRGELSVGKKKMKIFTWYSQLSKAQQYISKYIRHGSMGKDKAVIALQLLESATSGIIDFCGIPKRDIAKMEAIKFKRLQDRIRNGELT